MCVLCVCVFVCGVCMRLCVVCVCMCCVRVRACACAYAISFTEREKKIPLLSGGKCAPHATSLILCLKE